MNQTSYSISCDYEILKQQKTDEKMQQDSQIDVLQKVFFFFFKY